MTFEGLQEVTWTHQPGLRGPAGPTPWSWSFQGPLHQSCPTARAASYPQPCCLASSLLAPELSFFSLHHVPPNLVCCHVATHTPTCPELGRQGGQPADNTPSYTGKSSARSCALSCHPCQSRTCHRGVDLSFKTISGVSQQWLKRSHFSTKHEEKLCWSAHGLQ